MYSVEFKYSLIMRTCFSASHYCNKCYCNTITALQTPVVTQNRTAWQQKTEVLFVPSWIVNAAASEEALDYLQSAAGCPEVLVEVWLEGSFDSPGASPADDLAAAWIVFIV
jgi:hypothetical protein